MRLHAQAKNEELAQRAVGVSQEELDATRAEFEARLGAAERKAREKLSSWSYATFADTREQTTADLHFLA